MRLEFPKTTERIGSVSIHEIQKIYELDSQQLQSQNIGRTIKSFGNTEISRILDQFAIIISIKNENLNILEGVLSGIPNECLVIIVSNSQRSPVDRYAMELDMLKQYSRYVKDKKIITMHQKDPELANMFRKIGYTSILENDRRIRDSKAAGMVIGMIFAKIYKKQYVGFIEGDNYVPGAVNEYIKIFAAGFGMSSTPYCNVRISWSFKPKIMDNTLIFEKYDQILENTNKHLNSLISGITEFETDIIKTGNAGEQALSMALAENLHYASGRSIETHELVDIFEKFSDPISSKITKIGNEGVEIFQIETRNPHFHENKHPEQLIKITEESLLSIYSSKICPQLLLKKIENSLISLKNPRYVQSNKRKITKIEPINTIKIEKLFDLITNSGILKKFGFDKMAHLTLR